MEFHSLLLVTLQVLGLAIGTGSAIWGLANKTSYEDEHGHRHLTFAGHVSILLATGSFLVAAAAAGTKLYGDRQSELVSKEAARLKEQVESRREQRRAQDVNDARLSALEQRSLILAEADAAKQRAAAQLLRDLELNRAVFAGSQSNLSRTNEVLEQTERLLQPIGRPKVQVAWQIGPSDPAARSVLKGVRELGDKVRAGDPQALASVGMDGLTTPYAAQLQDMLLGNSTDALPVLLADPALRWTVTPTPAVALFSSEDALAQNQETLTAWASAASPLIRLGSLRFRLDPQPGVLGYNFASQSVWFETALGDEDRIASTGDVVSIPDLERAILVVDIGAGPTTGSGSFELRRRAQLGARPRSARIDAGGRTYQIPGAKFSPIRLRDGRTLFFAVVGPPAR